MITLICRVLPISKIYKEENMEGEQFHEEMSIIRNMIERTRRETFQSGYLFIIPGTIFLISVLVMGILEMTGHAQVVRSYNWIPFVLIAVASLSIGLWEGNREKTKARTYTRRVFTHLWAACGLVIVLNAMVVPHMAYTTVSWFLIVGIGFYVTGVIYELPLVQLSGVIWWIGMCSLGFIQGNIRLLIWVATIFFGFILPGIILNMQYRKQETGHGA